MKNFLVLFLAIFVLGTVNFCWAQESGEEETAPSIEIGISEASSEEPVEPEEQKADEFFKAVVIKIIDQQELIREDGSTVKQQNVRLKGLEGEWLNQEMNFYGIGELDVISSNVYEKGDKVIALASPTVEGEIVYYITDYVRSNKIFWLVIIFAIIIIFIAHWKGFKSLLSLVLTFLIILWFIIPRILAGTNPLLISIIGSFIILLLIVYITEGLDQKSHLSVISILISLIITGLLGILFSSLAKLTGAGQEEAMYLIGLGESAIDFRGLLLAGIIIGTLGVLDDVVISQVSAVEELKKANPSLPPYEIFRRAMKIGTSHIGSMTNTLFLAYAGAAMPLLLVFSIHQEPFVYFSQVINNEMIATEIIRALVGSIGLALAVPLATGIASYYLKIKEK